MKDADSLAFPEDMQQDIPQDDLNEVVVSDLIGIIQKRFTLASQARLNHEERMIQAYNNFRGLYGKSEKFRRSEKSRIFVKATKTKVLAGYGQVVDIIMGDDKFPIGIAPTLIPEGADDIAHVAPQGAPEQEEDFQTSATIYDVGYAGDGRELPPGTTFGSQLKKLLSVPFSKKEQMLRPGPAPSPEIATIRPADEAAYRMEKLIQDQLIESDSTTELSNALFEMVMLGTGIIKGPFTFTKTLHKWVKGEDGKRTYQPCNTKVPRIEFVSVWDAYPDPNATCKKELSYFIHRHRLNDSQLRGLTRMPQFRKEEIMAAMIDGPNYTKQSYEDSLYSSLEENGGRDFSDRFEVLEYWGVMGVKEAKDMGLRVEGKDEMDEIQINAWVCGNRLLRLVLNPFTPSRIPYHIFNYERNPYSIFGIGIPENMSDSQQIMNGHARMAVDNLALAGGLVFDIDETQLVPGQDTEIYNGKIFWRQAGSPGQAVHGIKFPNTAVENMMMFDKFRQIADEETGLPSYSHGQTGVTGMTRTASGMSMLMGAASLSIKTVIKNLDHQLFKPLGEDFFHWNMQFFEGDLDIHGDLEVRATGTNSLMQKEVRSQRLTMFLQTAMNPAAAPFIKIPYIIEELAKSLDLDKDKILNSTEEARAFAQIIGMQNSGQAASQATPGLNQEPAGVGGPPGVSPVGGAEGSTGTGDGTIGTGIVPQPGEDEFPA